MRTYRLLTPANEDLTAILAYLHSNSPAAASRFLSSLDRRLSLLATQPKSGHRRDEFQHPDLLFITFGAYIVGYFPNTVPLSIAAILHGSQDLTRIFPSR